MTSRQRSTHTRCYATTVHQGRTLVCGKSPEHTRFTDPVRRRHTDLDDADLTWSDDDQNQNQDPGGSAGAPAPHDRPTQRTEATSAADQAPTPARVRLHRPGQQFTVNGLEYTFIRDNGHTITLADPLGEFDVSVRLDDEAALFTGGLA